MPVAEAAALVGCHARAHHVTAAKCRSGIEVPVPPAVQESAAHVRRRSHELRTIERGAQPARSASAGGIRAEELHLLIADLGDGGERRLEIPREVFAHGVELEADAAKSLHARGTRLGGGSSGTESAPRTKCPERRCSGSEEAAP